jgi:hypothetical protein
VPRARQLIRSWELSTASPCAAMIKMVTGSLLKQLEAYISHKNMFIPQARLNRACGIFLFCKNNHSHQMNIYIHKHENVS